MDYNELTFIAKQKKITLEKLAKMIGLKSRQGLQSGVQNKSLEWAKIEELCKTLGFSPNELFGWDSQNQNGSGNYASHISGGNTQNSNEAIIALKDQLKEKDKQINRLLAIIEKGKKQ